VAEGWTAVGRGFVWPDWGGEGNKAILAGGGLVTLVMANIGTTITPWQIFFQQSAVVDKGMDIRDIAFGKVDTFVGSFLTGLVAIFIIIATGAAFYYHRPDPIIVEDAWGEQVDPQKLEDALKKNPDARLVAFVHAETSTGVQSDAKTLVRIAHKHNALAIVDTVTSLGGTPVLTDDWNVDAIYSASQKCLSCTPGLSPVSFSEPVVEYVKARRRVGA
jgi:hypothetical protein